MKRKMTALLAAAIILITGGVSTAVYAAEDGKKITMRQAMDAVLELMPNGTLEAMQLSGSAFQSTVLDGNQRYTVTVNALTGEIDDFSIQTAAPAATAPPSATAAPAPQPAASYTQPIQNQPVYPQTVYPQTTGYVSADEARGIASSYLGYGTVVRHETKRDHYKICIQSGNEHHDITINFNGTLRMHKTREITSTHYNAYQVSGGIGFDRAASIAAERAGGGALIKNELHYKRKEGVSVYKVDIVVNGQTEHKFEIDAASGYVIKYHTKYTY